MEFPTSQQTREDARIEQNRERMGVIFFRKEGESLGLSSGSIVKLKGSKLIRKCEKIKCCLLTSDKYLPVTSGIGEGDYFFEYWSSDLKTVKKLSLREVAQSDVFYHPSAGLALIPVCPSWASKLRLKSSVLDERRTFPTSYHSGGGECANINKYCYIVRSCGCMKESLTVERFTLITKRDDQGQVQYGLQDVSETIFRNHDEIIAKWSNLYPHGAVILENEGLQPTCIGILNFTEEGLISPVFFTPETFTGKVQLYYPTSTAVEEEASSVAIRCSEGKIEPNTSQIDSAVYSQEVPCSATAPLQAPCPIVTGYESQSQIFSSAGAENQDGASLTNDDQTVYPDDYTLQKWQKLYEKVEDENTKLKQQSEHDQEVISLLKDGNAELRNDIKRTEQENEELRAENEDLRKGNENLRSKTEELRTRCKQLREDRDAESIKSREDYQELLTENEQLRTINKELREHNRRLRAENSELRAENSELRKDWNAESEELRELNKELRAQNNELKTEHKELLTEKEELSAKLEEVADQLKELLNQPDNAVCGDDTSSIKDSNNVKEEEPSGSSANSPQGDADGSRKEEEPFLDPLSKDVSKLD